MLMQPIIRLRQLQGHRIWMLINDISVILAQRSGIILYIRYRKLHDATFCNWEMCFTLFPQLDCRPITTCYIRMCIKNGFSIKVFFKFLEFRRWGRYQCKIFYTLETAFIHLFIPDISIAPLSHHIPQHILLDLISTLYSCFKIFFRSLINYNDIYEIMLHMGVQYVYNTVHVKYDTEMHHGPNRGSKKT